MATKEIRFVENEGACPTEIHAVIWDNENQAEVTVTKQGEKRNTVVGFVLKDKQLDDFINFLLKAGADKK